MHPTTRHLLKVGLVANLFEWYEFAIFGFLAPVISQLFFDTTNSFQSLVYTYQVFAVSFVMRPLGSIFFGILGDRYGKNTALRFSLMLMSIPTILIGLLPTYNQIGTVALVSLIILRIIQGISAGGELPTTACYILENSTEKDNSMLCSIIVASPKIGILLAAFTASLLLKTFNDDVLLAWAWRIPFLLGIPLTLTILYIRSSIDLSIFSEKHSFQEMTHWSTLIKPMLAAISLVSFGSVYFYTVFMWFPTYLYYLKQIPLDVGQLNTTVILAITIPIYLATGYISKQIGYQKLIFFSTCLVTLITLPLFFALHFYSNPTILFLVQLLLAIAYVGVDGVLIEVLGKILPEKSRSISFGLAWTLPAAFVGGTTPLVCMQAIQRYQWTFFPAFYIMIFALLILPITYTLYASPNHIC